MFSPGDAAFEMEACTEDVCLIGHSHYPGTFELFGGQVQYSRDAVVTGRPGRRYLVNVPSVGRIPNGATVEREVELTAPGLSLLGPVAETIARMEGLDAHANAVTVRLEAIARRSGA